MATEVRESDRPVEGEIVESGTLEALTRGEIDIQIRTAKTFPRSVQRFIDEAKSLATLDEETAEACIYALPRDGRMIEGPSARLAEIVAYAWGNCRAGARVVAEEADFVVAQGAFVDLERNVAITFDARRRIIDRNGRRYSADMIAVTSNAACSIALRNAVLKGVPKAFWSPVYQAAKHTAVGDQQTLERRRADMVAYFGKMGVTEDRVLGLLGKQEISEITLDDLAKLKGVATAVKENEISIDEAFPKVESNGGSRAEAVLSQIREKRQAKAAKPEPSAEAAAAEPKPDEAGAEESAETISTAADEAPETPEEYLERIGTASWKASATQQAKVIDAIKRFFGRGGTLDQLRLWLNTEFSVDGPTLLSTAQCVKACKGLDGLLLPKPAKEAEAGARAGQAGFFE